MGRLVNGEWEVQEVNPETDDGEFHRQKQKFRSGLKEGGEFPPEKGRYHLYVSLACPWAHRALIMRRLKGLEDFIGVSAVAPEMLEDGWSFEKTCEGATGDKVWGKRYLRQIYVQADPKFTGRVTVPALLDKESKKIVNNESSDIVRIFNGLNAFASNGEDFYPPSLRAEIDRVNEDVYENINNGVYKTGFARKQGPYEKNFKALFDSLDRQEERLEGKAFIAGESLTEADVRLYTTLIRFDAVYFTHFKCNLRMIKDYKNLRAYLKKLYAIPAFKETTDFYHIKRHYFFSHETLNPFRLVPPGPDLSYLE